MAIATEGELIERFLDALRALPEVCAELEPHPPHDARAAVRIGGRVGIKVAGKPLTLLIEVNKTLFPRDVREILWRFRAVSHMTLESTVASEMVLAVIAESISPGARELLRDARVGYYDSGGSLFLPARGLYLYVEKPVTRTISKSLHNLFSRRRAQVLHALLAEPEDWFGVVALAKRAGVSPATVSQVLMELERFDWVVARGRGPAKERSLREPAALLDAWVKQLAVMQLPTMRRYYVPAVRAEGLIAGIDRVFAARRLEYAITHEAAAQRYAPFLSRVSQVRCRLVTSPAAQEAIAAVGGRRVNEGTNLAVIEAASPGELLFREWVNGAWLASPIQVYLDLVHGEGRAPELAEHLRRQRIGF
ncbi:MAG: hypothetical protein OXH96_25480 [Spirochaetaceae bacterium]|nr:hypothetical protein [Spirochaetaceae bacterium]